MDFHYRVERLQFAACSPDAAITKGAPTSCLFFLPCSFFSTSLPSLCQAPPPFSLHPSSPSRSPPPQSQAGTRSSTPQHQLQKRGFFPSSSDSLVRGGGGDSKARNMYTTACFIITSFLGPSYFPNNQQLKLIALSTSSPGKKKVKCLGVAIPGRSPPFM